MRILISWPSCERKNKNAGAVKSCKSSHKCSRNRSLRAMNSGSGLLFLQEAAEESSRCFSHSIMHVTPRFALRASTPQQPRRSLTTPPPRLAHPPSLRLSATSAEKKTHLAASANLSQAAEDPITVVMRATRHCGQAHTAQ